MTLCAAMMARGAKASASHCVNAELAGNRIANVVAALQHAGCKSTGKFESKGVGVQTSGGQGEETCPNLHVLRHWQRNFGVFARLGVFEVFRAEVRGEASKGTRFMIV